MGARRHPWTWTTDSVTYSLESRSFCGPGAEALVRQIYELRLLRDVGLRPTRQRIAVTRMLFGFGNRHVTAEMLYEEANRAGLPVSMATVYNTLRHFTGLGLLRQIGVDGSKTYFDTNVTHHHHFFIKEENSLLDISGTDVAVGKIPAPPEGYEIKRIDVVVHLRRKER